jgi:hypothetical protein
MIIHVHHQQPDPEKHRALPRLELGNTTPDGVDRPQRTPIHAPPPADSNLSGGGGVRFDSQTLVGDRIVLWRTAVLWGDNRTVGWICITLSSILVSGLVHSFLHAYSAQL